MFVCWKKRKLRPLNDRSDVECLHVGPDRWSWTPIVAESFWTPGGSRRRTVIRPSPAIRSCCMQDPIVRVRWWNATADILGTAKNIDVERVMSQLAERVPLPSHEDEIIFDSWPPHTPWTRWGLADAGEYRARIARIARRLAIDQIRPGDTDWEDAVSAWHKADAAFDRGDWQEYVRYEKKGLDSIGRAIPKARSRAAPDGICADAWLEAFREHVRRLEERRAQREVEEARRRVEEDRRREREADEERRRAAHEARRRSSRSRPRPAGPQSVVERMNAGGPSTWAAFLGITFPCTREELKKAYRATAFRLHPDRGGDNETLKAVNIAKERLERELQWMGEYAH